MQATSPGGMLRVMPVEAEHEELRSGVQQPLPVLRAAVRFLTFRLTREEFVRLGPQHLLFGILCTWIVGVGRWWDDPDAQLIQHLGLGSVFYVFALALLLWLIIWPLKPQSWSYSHVLTVVTLTAPPAMLYAIPVERFTPVETARSLNAWFLAVVAAWRVALLFFYLRRHARLRLFSTTIAVLLPMTLVITTLTFLNLERAVFNVMGGFEETANDGAYAVLLLLTIFSVILFIPVSTAYLVILLDPANRSQPQAGATDTPPDSKGES